MVFTRRIRGGFSNRNGNRSHRTPTRNETKRCRDLDNSRGGRQSTEARHLSSPQSPENRNRKSTEDFSPYFTDVNAATSGQPPAVPVSRFPTHSGSSGSPRTGAIESRYRARVIEESTSKKVCRGVATPSPPILLTSPRAVTLGSTAEDIFSRGTTAARVVRGAARVARPVGRSSESSLGCPAEHLDGEHVAVGCIPPYAANIRLNTRRDRWRTRNDSERGMTASRRFGNTTS